MFFPVFATLSQCHGGGSFIKTRVNSRGEKEREKERQKVRETGFEGSTTG